MAKKIIEHISRSLAKTLTFRALAILIDLIIVFTITKRFDTTLGFVIFSNLVKGLSYYFHERVWNNVHWGRHHG